MDTSLLLQTLASRSGLGEGVNLLGGAGGGDSTSALLANLLTQRQGETRESDEEADSEAEVARKQAAMLAQQLQKAERRLERAQERYAELAEAVTELRSEHEAIYSELEELRRRNNEVSAALGACYLCWGADPQCELCGGRGRPGYYRLDRTLFAELAGPALRQLQQQASRKKTPPAHGPARPGSLFLFNQTNEIPLKGDLHE